MDFYFTNLRFLLFAWRWLILISVAVESSGQGGGGEGDRVKLVSLMSLVELLISSNDLSFVIQLTTTMKKKIIISANLVDIKRRSSLKNGTFFLFPSGKLVQ